MLGYKITAFIISTDNKHSSKSQPQTVRISAGSEGSKGRLNIPRLINQLGYNQLSGFYVRLLQAVVIAASNNRCLFPIGRLPLPPRREENTVAWREVFLCQHCQQPVVAGKKFSPSVAGLSVTRLG